MSLSLSSNSTTLSNRSTIGIIRIRTNKFLEMRKKISEENSFSKCDSASSLNDNGKTRLAYFNIVY